MKRSFGAVRQTLTGLSCCAFLFCWKGGTHG
nr:MAG TPA: hypothetical protein [Caudoviricetes sp.]